jgi:hypothetical protein
VHYLFYKHDASFFIGDLFEPLTVLRMRFLFVKHDASFFIGGLFEPMGEGSDSVPLLMASSFGAKVLV